MEYLPADCVGVHGLWGPVRKRQDAKEVPLNKEGQRFRRNGAGVVLTQGLKQRDWTTPPLPNLLAAAEPDFAAAAMTFRSTTVIVNALRLRRLPLLTEPGGEGLLLPADRLPSAPI